MAAYGVELKFDLQKLLSTIMELQISLMSDYIQYMDSLEHIYTFMGKYVVL